MNARPSHRPEGDSFATTHWSLVLAAAKGTPTSHAALEQLCQTYWTPLYAYIRRRVPDENEAHDLTQAFFETVLEKGYLADASAERGRFRAFLLTAFKHFLSKEWERQRALKRGGGRKPLSLDFTGADSAARWEPADDLTPDQVYEREWAVTLLSRVLQRLQNELQEKGRGEQFEYLKEMLVGRPKQGYAELGSELGMNAAAARMAASRLRKRYRQLLREEIAQTVASADEVDDEIRHLFEILAR